MFCRRPLIERLPKRLHVRIDGFLTGAGKFISGLLGRLEVDHLLFFDGLHTQAAPLAVDTDKGFREAGVLVPWNGILHVAHLGVIQPELVGPVFVHPVEAVELLDRTLVKNRL